MVQTARPRDVTSSAAPAGRRLGYVIAAGINVALLWVAHHLLAWGWPRFLTDDFDRVLPIITVSASAAVALNVAYVAFDPPWFRSLGNVLTSALGIAAAARMLSVFPFDFSTYARDWSWLVRTLLILGIVGGAIAVIVELVRLAHGPSGRR